MSRKRQKKKHGQPDNPAVTLPGTVEKIIPPIAEQPEKAQIDVKGADELYEKLRVENTLQDEKGNQVGLKEGAEVEVTIDADSEATEPKKDKTKGASS